MSQSRELRLHIEQLEEIRSILNSMKNLALIEIQKLARFQTLQSLAVANIEQAAMDFMNFYPVSMTTDTKTAHYCILIGAERGFCGDFNQRLIDSISAETYTGIIAIGSRLGSRLEDSPLEVMQSLEGASVAEEIPTIIHRLLDTLGSLQQTQSAESSLIFKLSAVYHDNVIHQISQRQILPPFPQATEERNHYGNPPLLNLEPAVFFSDLTDHYLLAVLHEILSISLLAENHQRLQHLEGAVNHLDDETVNLRRKSQSYRQEEITEEIEVILLNAESHFGAL
jgi:F-type H+-transporting ATPase subunit gamma